MAESESQKISQEALDAAADENDGASEDVGALGLPLPRNHAPVPKFGNLHFLFHKLANTNGHGSTHKRNVIITGFIKSWRRQVGNDLYPFVRLWFSEEDDQLKQLRKIKDTMLAKLLVEALALPAGSPDAILLMDVRKGAYTKRFTASNSKDDGFPLRAKEAIEKRYPQTQFSTWTVDDVAKQLVLFADGKKADRVAILRDLLDTMNADEMFWVLKIIMGNVSLNCSVRSFLALLHPDAEKVYLVNKNLRMVCQQLWSEDFTVSESAKCVHLLSHFFPMRARFVKGTAEDMQTVVDLMKAPLARHEKQMKLESVKSLDNNSPGSEAENDRGPHFYLEEKIDGVRVQLHWVRKHDEIAIFSRNGKDHTLAYQSIFWDEPISDFYGAENRLMVKSDDGEDSGDRTTIGEGQSPVTSSNALAKSGKSPSFSMSDIVADHVESCIIDGEIVAWDPSTNDICGQSKVRELASHQRGGQYRHLFLVFDVVLVNGESITEESLKSRKAELEKLLPESKRHLGKGRIQILPYKIGFTADDISTEFNRIIGQMSEGLVVKNPESIYQIDGRNNSWIKVKPEFVDGYQGENLDLVVAGCYWGKGKNSGTFASYLCVVRDETKPDRYVALSRVGSGICLAMYNYINGLIEPHRFAQKKPPSWLVLGSERPPDFYIDPNVSIVLEVKYSSVSSVLVEGAKQDLGYGVGYSLRFPRYARLREDKDVRSALTIAELLEVQHYLPNGDLHNKRSHPSVPSSTSPRKFRRIRQDALIESVEPKSSIFNGRTFYICGDITDPSFMTRPQVERLVQENGGRTTSLMTIDAIAIADKKNTNAAKLVLAGVSVIRPQYLFDCITNGRKVELEQTHFLSGAPVVDEETRTVDAYGFSLFRIQSKRDVERIFNGMDPSLLHYNESKLRNAMAYLLKPGASSESLAATRAFLFSGLSFYVKERDLEYPQLVRNKLVYGNATLVDNAADADYVVQNGTNPSDLEHNNKIVKETWVQDSWKSVRLLDH